MRTHLKKETESTKKFAPHLNPVWLKAATVGSMWAALEIVLGSFLHNIRMPMTGTILAACGIVLLTASQLVWHEKGLIWRAGIICAIMKSISPSAVILGPMVGIMTEALVMQFAVFLLGRNKVALVIGGMLALLEPAIHRIVSLILEYGLNIGTLYIRLYDFAARSLHIESFGPLDLVFTYFALNMAVGLVAVFMGVIVAKRAQSLPLSEPAVTAETVKPSLSQPKADVAYHPFLLLVHLMIMIGGFILIRKLPLYLSALLLAIYVALCFWRYEKIKRVFRKPKLWIEILLIGMLASLLLGNLTGDETGWTWNGLEAGLQMAIRAILVTVAFASIGSELRNPRIVNWFMRRGWGTLSSATDIAFEALPTMIAALNEEKQILRSPIRAIAHVLATGMKWLEDYSLIVGKKAKVFLLSGGQGTGKTTLMKQLAGQLQNSGINFGGILAPVVYKDNQRIGYDLFVIATKEQRPLCRLQGINSKVKAGNFVFDASVLEFGNTELSNLSAGSCNVVIIDEIGPLELSGQGWSESLSRTLVRDNKVVILSVRSQLIEQVATHWGFTPQAVWEVEKSSIEQIQKVILNIV